MSMSAEYHMTACSSSHSRAGVNKHYVSVVAAEVHDGVGFRLIQRRYLSSQGSLEKPL